ncbi:MAG: M14 family metallopeptidase [Oscillospiraceae bacterium]|nr:M14 family metallopeptidase [Oscillospiraceae bacterium]
MEKVIVYEKDTLYRDPFQITGYRFGTGEKSACIVGNTRGNENQQIFCCSQLVRRLKQMEAEGRVAQGHEIFVIPSANPYSVNIKKRFWGIDNTDINRMFPGYAQGETTQRIAAGIFDAVRDYRFGIQFASFYMRGRFIPHVRMMQTGYEDAELAARFGLPYVILRRPRPFDTATLNYNWQIWGTQAFSIYTTDTDMIDRRSAQTAVEAILRFLATQGILTGPYQQGQVSRIVDDSNLSTVRAGAAGFFESLVEVGTYVGKGAPIARITDPCDGELLEEIFAPEAGTVIFVHGEPMTYDNTAVFKLSNQ